MPSITEYHDVINADSPIYAGQGTVGSDGTVVGSPTTTGTAPTLDTADSGLQFNGTNEYVNSGFVSAPNGNGPFSIEFWCMPGASGNGGSLVASIANPGTVDNLSINLTATSAPASGILAANVLVSLGAGGTTWAIDNMGNGPFPASWVRASVWNHVVVTFDGLLCALYVNGVRVAQENVAAAFSPATLSDLLISAAGEPTLGVGQYCDAAMADVSMYSYPLTIQQVMYHFSARSGVPAYPNVSTYTGDYYPTIIGDNPLGYWRCDETAGALAKDRSGNGNDGAYCLGVFTLSEPGAIYDGNAAVLLQEPPPSGGFDPTPAGIVTPLESISFTTQFTVEAWCFINSLTRDVEICSTSGDDPSVNGWGWSLWVDTGGTLHCQISDINGNVGNVSSGSPIPSGAFVYIALTFDQNDVILYINGTAAGSTAYTFGAGPWHTNLVWGFLANSLTLNTSQYPGVIDEPAIYNYALTPTQVMIHYIAGLGPLPPPPTGSIANNDQHYFIVKIYDKKGNLVDIPQSDIDSLSLADGLNGGSSTSTMTFVRDFNAVGAINYLYSVQVWIWNGRIPQPLNPCWSGYMVDIDQEKTRTLGKLTIHMEGDQKQLDRASVYEDVNPLVDGNPPLDAADYIRHLYTTYAPPGFCTLNCPATLFPLLPGQYEMMQLGQVIDTVLKTGRDDLGNLITWRVNRDYQLNRTLLVQPDQNPNTVSGVKFKMLFLEQIAKYAIHTKYSEICNVVTIQGGQDIVTGLPVVGSFIDENSVGDFGPWEQIISVWQLIDQAACDSYGETFLDIHSNPQATGDIELHNPDPTLLSGVWIQVWDNASVIRQMRITSVRWEVGRSRIKQTLTPTAPTPYLDYAVYKMGLNSANNGVNQISQLPVQTQGNYVRTGGNV